MCLAEEYTRDSTVAEECTRDSTVTRKLVNDFDAARTSACGSALEAYAQRGHRVTNLNGSTVRKMADRLTTPEGRNSTVVRDTKKMSKFGL
jgi:hypothetical protein